MSSSTTQGRDRSQVGATDALGNGQPPRPPSERGSEQLVEGRAPSPSTRLKVAYVMSRFPKLTETFILYEIVALEKMGVATELYPLLRERQSCTHPEADSLVERAHYFPFVSWPIIRSQLSLLRRKPLTYLGALWAVLRGTWGSLNFFVGALAIFPKVAHAALRMEEEGVTHVHCHFANHPAAAGFVIHRLVGIPYSFTAHGTDLHVERRMLPQKVEEAAFVRAISEFNRDLILDECGGRWSEKLVLLHCGVDTSLFRPPDPPQTMSSETRLEILCVGTLYEVKGQTHLIEACRLLAEQGVDFVCHLVGDGPDEAKLRAQVEAAGLGERVVFTGPQPRAEVARLMRSADVLVLPSVGDSQGRREGIPVCLMEAMSCGVPVLASRMTGIPELVKDGQTGVLVPPGDPVQLANALAGLHSDPPLRLRLGAAGRETILRGFDLDANTEELAALFAAPPR
ncbi:MAG TPA: glycosyltransferase [Gaiellaceae bacterium]|nr:glycosyltransferase [Gaiellaceae bacterium]